MTLVPRARAHRASVPRRNDFPGPGPTLFAAFVALVVCSLALSPAVASDWKGKEIAKDGVLHIMNPVEAMEKPTEVAMKELWRLGGESEDENEFFGVIVRITTDSEGNVYLLDSQLSEVKIYSPDGEFLKSIGREGEGPGEFRRPSDMFFVPDGDVGVMQTIPGKIVLLTPDGDPAGDFPIPQPDGGGFQILRGGQLAGQNLALVRQTQEIDQEKGEARLRFAVDLISSEGTLLTTMEEKTVSISFASTVITENMFDTFENRWTVGDDGRVLACTDRDKYLIKVWSPEGTLERIIEREYTPYKRTADEKKEVEGIWTAFTRRVPNSTLDMSDTDKAINNVYVRDDGSIWVLSAHGARKRPEGSIGTFDVLDSEGHFVRQVTLKGQGNPREDAYFFDGDRVYVVTGFLQAALAAQGGGSEDEADLEEEPTPMEVICYRIDAPLVAKGQ